MLNSSFCDCSDAYILVEGTVTVVSTLTTTADVNNTNKKVILKNCTPFTDCTSKISNNLIDNVKDHDIVMPVYNLMIH